MRTDGGGQWLPALPANASGAAKWLVTQPKLEAEEEEEAEAEGAGASVRHVLGDAYSGGVRHVLEGEAYFYSQQDFNFFYYPFDKQVRVGLYIGLVLGVGLGVGLELGLASTFSTTPL